MERLHRLVFLCGVAWCLLGSSPVPAAQGYCSLNVRVQTPDGHQQPAVSVEVQERNRRKIEKEEGVTGDVQFCDLGILPVTVVVGLHRCNQVAVNDVPLSWKRPYTLYVTYDFEPCVRDLPPPPTPYCKVLLRVKGSDGKWVRDATVKYDPDHPALQTDSAGRAFTVVTLNKNLRGSISAPGYSLKTFSIACSELRSQEEILTLTKK